MKKMILWGVLVVILMAFACDDSADRPASELPDAAISSARIPSVSGTPFSSSQPTEVLLKGVSLSPRSYQQEHFLDFLSKVGEVGSILMWAGSWDEIGDEQGAPRTVIDLASQYGYIPLIEATHFIQDTGELQKVFDAQAKTDYKASAVAFARSHQPPYLGFGIEINVLHEKSPDDFQAFVPFYNEVYHEIKQVSPNTRVFTIFQLEKMKGLPFWGDGVVDPEKAQWWMLDSFETDLAVFTTYPGLVYTDPADIPTDYYSQIADHTSQSVAFTEIGWHSDAYPPGWEGSESEQAAFIKIFFEQTQALDMELAIWSFMYGQDTLQPFDSMGLRRDDGSVKPAWDAWINPGS